MIDHTGIAVGDLETSGRFYAAVLATLGYEPTKIYPGAMGFGARDRGPADDPGGDFWISLGTPYTPRCHIAFRAANAEQVRAFHSAALAAGGRDNGAPGLRPQYHARYFAAFVLDPDGYNIEAVFHGGE